MLSEKVARNYAYTDREICFLKPNPIIHITQKQALFERDFVQIPMITFHLSTMGQTFESCMNCFCFWDHKITSEVYHSLARVVLEEKILLKQENTLPRRKSFIFKQENAPQQDGLSRFPGARFTCPASEDTGPPILWRSHPLLQLLQKPDLF